MDKAHPATTRWAAFFIAASGWELVALFFGLWMGGFAGPGCTAKYFDVDDILAPVVVPESDGWCTFATSSAPMVMTTFAVVVGFAAAGTVWFLIYLFRPSAVRGLSLGD